MLHPHRPRKNDESRCTKETANAPKVGEARHPRAIDLDVPDQVFHLALDPAFLNLERVLLGVPVGGDVVSDSDKLGVVVRGREDDDRHPDQVRGGGRRGEEGERRGGGGELERVETDGDGADLEVKEENE